MNCIQRFSQAPTIQEQKFECAMHVIAVLTLPLFLIGVGLFRGGHISAAQFDGIVVASVIIGAIALFLSRKKEKENE